MLIFGKKSDSFAGQLILSPCNLSHLESQLTDLGCPGFLQQFYNGGDGVSSDDGVVNQHHPFAGKVVRQGPELLGDPQLPQAGVGLNESPSHVAVLAQNLDVRQP